MSDGSGSRRDRRALKALQRSIRKLERQGANYIASPAQLTAAQALMLTRFSRADVPTRRWRSLKKCKPGRCRRTGCSAACWFGDRGKTNSLILEAAKLLEAAGKPLWFVTIIDPHQVVPVGSLHEFSLSGAMASLRRRFRLAADLFGDDPAFGFIEVALEVLPDGSEWWSPHLHIVIASDAGRSSIREALRPARRPPDPDSWGRKRFKTIEVKPVTHLVNALAYSGKRTPEINGNFADPEAARWRQGGRLPAVRRDEHDLWLLSKRPSDRIFKRRFKEIHGMLRLFRPSR